MRELGADGRSRPARLRVGDPHAVHGSAWCQPSRSTSAKPQPRANAGPAEDVAAADTAAAVAEVPECQIWHAAGEVAGRSTGRGVFADSVRRFVLGGAAAGHGASHHLATQAAMRKLADHWLSPFAAGIREADLTPVLGENRSHCHRRSPSRICPLVKIPPLLGVCQSESPRNSPSQVIVRGGAIFVHAPLDLVARHLRLHVLDTTPLRPRYPSNRVSLSSLSPRALSSGQTRPPGCLCAG